MSIVLLIVGLVVLVAGAEGLVRGASWSPLSWGISPLVVGLTIVALGTSAPEMAVSVGAAANGTTDLAVDNLVGSHIFNILVCLGLAGVVAPRGLPNFPSHPELRSVGDGGHTAGLPAHLHGRLGDRALGRRRAAGLPQRRLARLRAEIEHQYDRSASSGCRHAFMPIGRAFLMPPSQTRGHLYLVQRGHFYFGLTELVDDGSTSH